ncbi:hypothetical protein AMTRI_Chr06g201680 [Amborella trichopoda]
MAVRSVSKFPPLFLPILRSFILKSTDAAPFSLSPSQAYVLAVSQESLKHLRNHDELFLGFAMRCYHDGRPRGPLWRGKKLIGKEALFIISGLKRFKDDEGQLDKFVKSHVSRLLKMDMVAVLCELERQEEVILALKVRDFLVNLYLIFLLLNRIKQDFEEMFPDRHVYDPPEEIFGLR